MSRVGLNPISLPAGVEINVDDHNIIKVKGPKGELEQKISKLIQVKNEDGTLSFSRKGDSKEERAQHGLSRALVANMVEGVTNGYVKRLEINGVGYKAEKKEDTLVLNLGFSHPVEMKDPEGITTEVPETTVILVKGISKEAVGNYAANIRALRRPEPYKGKGIKYAGEKIRRKEGKAGAK